MKVVEQFKRRILDLAIRGKLVPQDPNDEPASELLARIKAEKEKLIKAGKIKKGKSSAVGSDGAAYEKLLEDTSFELPKGWVWTHLPIVCEIPITDGTHQTPQYTTKDKGIPFLSSKDVVGCKIDWESSNIKYITKDLHEKLYRRLAPRQNDILLAKNGTTGVAALVDERRVFDVYVTLAVLRPCLMFPKYLLYVINSRFCKEQFNNRLTGIGLPNLHLEDIRKTVIPLPPLVEQKRIVARIEELFMVADSLGEAADGLETAAKHLDKKILDLAIRGKLVPQDPSDEPSSELLKRIAATSHKSTCKNYETPIEPPFEIPKSWEWVRLGEVFQHNTGKALNRSKIDGIMREYLTTSNVYWDGFKLESLKQMPFTDEELEKCMVRKGDLLVCEGGDIGRAAIWNIERQVCIQNHLHRLRPYDTKICVSFFKLVLQQYKYSGRIQGNGIGLQGFSSSRVHNLLIPLPPIAEQKRIVAKIEELRKATQALTM